jgi:hypothetical protein
LNRFLAADFVFILGILLLRFLGSRRSRSTCRVRKAPNDRLRPDGHALLASNVKTLSPSAL